MPNWCENAIVIKSDGDEEKFQKFKETLIGEDGNPKFSFQLHVPRPADQEENWYEWNCENWGTKWDAGQDGLKIEILKDVIHIFCITAWSPPKKWAQKIHKDFGVAIRIDYEDLCAPFVGIFILTSKNRRDEEWNPYEDSE